MSQHFTAQVLAGGRLEITCPNLLEGQTVEIIVTPCPEPSQRLTGSLLEFLDSLPPGPRSAPTWEEFERQFQEERDAWDR